MKKLISILIIVCLCVCCHHTATKDICIIQAEKELEQNPDSLLNFLENNINISLLNNYNKACYYLLLAEARFISKEDIYPMDSLINVAVNELYHGKTKYEYAKALYIKGIIFEETKSYPEAIRCYQNALNISKERYPALQLKIYRQLGDVYLYQQLTDEGLETFKAAYEMVAGKAEKEEVINSLLDIGFGYLFTENYDSAGVYYLKALEEAEKQRYYDPKKMDNIYNHLGIYYNEAGENEKALYYINKITQFYPEAYLNKGMVMKELNMPDSALYYLKLALSGKGLAIKVTAYKHISEIENNRKNYYETIMYMDSFVNVYEELNDENYAVEIQGINIKHNIQTEILRINNRKNSIIITIIFSAIVVIMALTFFGISYIRKRKRKSEQQMLKQKMLILEKEKQINELKTQISNTRIAIKVDDLNVEKFRAELSEKEHELLSLQQQLNNIRIHTFGQKTIYRKIKKLGEQTDTENLHVLNSKERESLKETVEKIYKDFITTLSEECTSLTEEDLLFCCLGKLNLSLIEICICTGYPRMHSARQRRYRIKKKIEDNYGNDEMYNSIFTL